MTALDLAFRRIPLAHRGLHDGAAGIIENSTSAFRAAVRAGYGIECDLQLSADGQAMVFHDYQLGRLTPADGNVSALTAAEMGRIALSGSQDHIPTLPQVLKVVGGRVPLLVEIKDQGRALSRTGIGPLERAVSRALEGYRGPVALMSFNPHAVAALAELVPEVPRGLTTGSFSRVEYPRTPGAELKRLRSIDDYDRTGAQFVSHSVQELDAPRLDQLRRERGAAILCWTVRSAKVEAAARKVVDNVTFEGYPAAIPPG